MAVAGLPVRARVQRQASPTELTAGRLRGTGQDVSEKNLEALTRGGGGAAGRSRGTGPRGPRVPPAGRRRGRGGRPQERLARRNTSRVRTSTHPQGFSGTKPGESTGDPATPDPHARGTGRQPAAGQSTRAPLCASARRAPRRDPGEGAGGPSAAAPRPPRSFTLAPGASSSDVLPTWHSLAQQPLGVRSGRAGSSRCRGCFSRSPGTARERGEPRTDASHRILVWAAGPPAPCPGCPPPCPPLPSALTTAPLPSPPTSPFGVLSRGAAWPRLHLQRLILAPWESTEKRPARKQET